MTEVVQFLRPDHKPDDGRAHIQFGQDPLPLLKKYGYCVVENVLKKDECDKTVDEIWDWLSGLNTGIKRDDDSTWNNNNWPFNIRGGLIQHTMAHEDFIWKIREHKNVVELYSQIFGTDKLLSSFGSLGVYRPVECGLTKPNKNSWLHTDQDVTNEYSIQGIVNLEDSDDKDAGFFVGEGSHLLHSKLFDHNRKKPEGNWYLITEDDLKYLLDNDIQFYKINAPKGSYTLFDSKAFHSGFPHQLDRSIKRFRYSLYITLSPAERATDADIDKKMFAVHNGRNTSHWASNHVVVFPIPDNPVDYMTRNKNIPDYEKWSDSRKRLAGIIPY